MVEISKSGSGEGSVWVTGRGYSTIIFSRALSSRTLKSPINSCKQGLGFAHVRILS